MIHVYEFFGDNPIVDALMLDTDRRSPLRSIRVAKPLLRPKSEKPTLRRLVNATACITTP